MRISTGANANYNAVTQDVFFIIKDSMTPGDLLHINLGLDPGAATSPDNGGLEAELYTPAR